ALKHVEGNVVRVWPNTQLRVIRERIEGKRVAIIRAGGIVRSRDRHALKERSSLGDSELCYHPAIYLLIVNHYRIAVVGSFASTAEATEECVDCHRTQGYCACGFIEHR